MNTVEVKFGEWIQKGFDLYKQNMGVLIVAGLITVLLSSITLGILAGPMSVGLILVTLALLDKKDPKPTAGNVFDGLKFFLPSFLYVLAFFGAALVSAVLVFIPCIGNLAHMAIMLGIATATMFTFFLIADQKMDFWPAVMTSLEKVKANPGMFLAFYLVAAVIGGLGAILCGIGVIITLPIQVCIMAVAYRDVFGGGQPTAAATPPAPPQA